MPATKATAKKTVKTTAAKPAKKAAKKVTIDDVWAGFERLEKFHEDLQKLQEDLQKKTQKAQDEAWKAIRETQRNIGGINNTLGSLVEHIMIPDLPRKFKQFGFSFERITTVKWAVEGSIYAEIDGLLENGAQAMVVEVKTTLREKDIDDHLIRMEKVRAYADEHGDKRQFMGAIAATITEKATKAYALSKGFFVIEPSGEDVKITKPVSEPRVW
jgi:diadenosine tetraphosphate (Ap4A) HIT family hydrolase